MGMVFCLVVGLLSVHQSVAEAVASNENNSTSVITLQKVLSEVYSKNLELAEAQAKVQTEEELVSSKYALSDPKLGWMTESNLTQEQRDMGSMKSWSLSQEILFPTKYFSMGSMQKFRVQAVQNEFSDKKLELRQKALTQYFQFYSAARILNLLQANKETLREISRVAEVRRATGAVPQQDEMKAHVEQTKNENEILLMSQDVLEAKYALNLLLNRDPDSLIELPKTDFKAPKLIQNVKAPQLNQLSPIIDANQVNQENLSSSFMVSAQRAWQQEAESAVSLAKMTYLPDFMLSYRKPYGANAPSDAYAFGIEMTIPLWFFAKQQSEVSAASARRAETEKKLEWTKRSVVSDIKMLMSKAKTMADLLRIYETALIPQAVSVLNSSRSAYSAGRVGFQELLEAERSLYALRIEFYRNFAKYIETLTSLERTAGVSMSELPMEGSH